MIPMMKLYVVENQRERYREKFRFASQARRAMEKHGVDYCKVLYLVDGKWSLVGEMGQNGERRAMERQ